MRIDFRQGLVSAEINASNQPNYLVTNSSGITLRAINRQLVFTVADGTKNYTITFSSDVLAWPAATLSGIAEGWLYIDINRSTAERTYGITTVAPSYGLTAPSSPVTNQHWFDTRNLQMKVFTAAGNWQRVIRVFAGKYTPTATTTMPIGSQVSLSGSYISGNIVSDSFGRVIMDSRGTFVTTEDVVMVEGAATHAAKLESNVDVAEAAVNIPAFHVVRYNDDGTLTLADYDDVGSRVVGLSVVDAVLGEPVSIVFQGKVHNPLWNFPRANLTLWVGTNGQLTSVDPYSQGGRAKPRVPVARTLDADTVIFDQGLGGVGEKGDSGDLAGIQVASPTVQGIATLSIGAEDPFNPVVVGTNDPRMSDARVPLAHQHAASDVSVLQFGSFIGDNSQQAFAHLDDTKLNKTGGTVSGNILSLVNATNDAHLITLGQTKDEIEAASIRARRYTLSDAASDLVTAFNALSDANRTVEPNNVLVLEYQTGIYLWNGTLGEPVVATDVDDFLLIGKTAGGFTIRAIESATLSVTPAPAEGVFILTMHDGIGAGTRQFVFTGDQLSETESFWMCYEKAVLISNDYYVTSKTVRDGDWRYIHIYSVADHSYVGRIQVGNRNEIESRIRILDTTYQVGDTDNIMRIAIATIPYDYNPETSVDVKTYTIENNDFANITENIIWQTSDGYVAMGSFTKSKDIFTFTLETSIYNPDTYSSMWGRTIYMYSYSVGSSQSFTDLNITPSTTFNTTTPFGTAISFSVLNGKRGDYDASVWLDGADGLRSVLLYSDDTGSTIASDILQYTFNPDPADTVHAVIISPSGTKIAVMTMQSTSNIIINLYDTETAAPLSTVSTGIVSFWPSVFFWTPSETKVIVAGVDDAYVVHAYSVGTNGATTTANYNWSPSIISEDMTAQLVFLPQAIPEVDGGCPLD